MTAQRLYRATAVMTAGTAISRVTGLVRIIALTYALGVTGTRLADTYQLANTTPNIVYELVLGGIFTSVFVPVLVELRRTDDDPSPLVTVSLVALGCLAVLTAVAAPLVMRIYTFRIADPVLRQAQLELATFLLRWFAPQIFFYGLISISQALMNVRGRFGPPMFAPIFNNLLVSGVLFAYAHWFSEQGLDLSTGAKTLLGAGTTAGVVIQALILLPYLRGERLRFRFDPSHPAVRRVLRLAVYVVGYVVVNQVGLWVVIALANGVEGGVASYQFAFVFFQLPHGLFAVSLITALLPDLSRAASASDWEGFRARFHDGIRVITFLLLPASVGYLVLARGITRVFLSHGVATVADADAVAVVLQAFAVGLVSFSTFQFLTRCFYAMPDTRTPLALNAVAVGANVAVDLPLFVLFGVRGLAFGHAIAYTLGTLLLLRALSRRIGGLGLRRIAGSSARTAAAAVGMGVAVWVLRETVGGHDAFGVAVAVGTGAMLYLAFSLVMGVEERRTLGLLVGRRRGEPRTRREPGDDTRPDNSE